MAFDEDLNKRREQREKLRQQRLLEQRRLITKLVIAGVVLVLCAVLVFVVVMQAGSDPQPTEPTTSSGTTAQTDASTQPPSSGTEGTGGTAEPSSDPTAGTTAPATTEATDTPSTTTATEPQGSTVIHFTAAGDVNITDTTAQLDFKDALMDVLPLLSGADLTAVNFEGNLVGAPYGAEYVSAPQTLMEALKGAGVDLIQMANSRTIHNGISSLGTTLTAIRAAGLEPVGAWATGEEARNAGGYTIREVDGVKLAIVAFTKGMDSMALPAGSEDCVNLLYDDYSTYYQDVDTEGITALLENLQETEAPDLTIALVHWGSEYQDQISGTQEEIRDLMLELGVDAIIGTHPHFVQAIEYDAEAYTLVAYSLGDLLGDGTTAGTQYSIVLDLEITKDWDMGVTRITGYSYTPIYNVRQEGQPLRMVRLNEAVQAYEAGNMLRVSAEMYEDMVYSQSRIEDRVTPDEEE